MQEFDPSIDIPRIKPSSVLFVYTNINPKQTYFPN
jgi:hypothetical protein